MKQFNDENFLLETATAQDLYHNHAAKMPIIDYHCHLIPKMVADNKLADYRITKITPAPSATIKCKIRLVPIEPVEDFDITIDLTSGSLEE